MTKTNTQKISVKEARKRLKNYFENHDRIATSEAKVNEWSESYYCFYVDFNNFAHNNVSYEEIAIQTELIVISIDSHNGLDKKGARVWFRPINQVNNDE